MDIPSMFQIYNLGIILMLFATDIWHYLNFEITVEDDNFHAVAAENWTNITESSLR
jgi:hypothetical protein